MREPAQLKCTWISRHFRREFSRQMPRPEISPTFCSSLQSPNGHGHVTRAIYARILKENAGAQKLGQTFARACAIEMQMDISKEPFSARILKANAAPQELAKLAAQTLREPAQAKFTWTCHKRHFMRELMGKKPEPIWSALIKHQPHLSVDTLVNMSIAFIC